MDSMAASSCVDFNRELIKRMVREALDYSCRKTGLPATDAEQLLKSGSGSAVEYLAYGIAVRAAELLGSTDQQVKSVHLFEASPDGDSPVLPVPLLVVVERETAAFCSLLDLLDRALLRECGELLGECLPGKLSHMLNAHVVTTRQVAERSGIAGLLSGYHNPSLTLWRRG